MGRELLGATSGFIGRAVERVEDRALLTGRGRFADDLPVRRDTLHAAILRSPHPHAEIVALDPTKALESPGVAGVLTGEDVKRWTKPFVVGVKQPMEHWCLAVDRVRYVGEPVAIVVASDRYLAEDALELIDVTYRPLPHVVDVMAATDPDAPLLHPAVGSNVVSDRRFHYGDVDAAFAQADRRVDLEIRYPRNACTPMECFVVIAEYDPALDHYDVLSNFQGPMALHPVMAMALKVPGSRLRLRAPPESGGSFGVKQAVFPYVVALSLAARKLGRPIKWVEDRLEHLQAATSASGRAGRISAAVAEDGLISGLEIEQHDDCGGYLRAPEPASLYRMHGNLSGAYRVRNIRLVNRVVLTNKTPSGLNRGFGGPQLYFALERLMQRIAVELELDPLEVIRRNLVPSDAFPYRGPSGGLLDSGDYAAGVEQAVRDGGHAELLSRRATARAEGRLYGIGYAAVVEPSISNMGYISTALTAEQRTKAGPKNGAQASATVALDALGSVSVVVASLPNGQGHRTVLQQVVGDTFGLAPDDVTVNVELDTQKDAWSIASGNYSSRFAGAVAGAAHLAAQKLRGKLARIAAERLNVPADEVAFIGGRVQAKGNAENAIPFARLAGTSHWSPGSLPDGAAPALRETEFWTPPPLEAPNDADEINSSAAYGFIFDFCGLEVDRATGRIRIDKYVTLHDAGRLLNPALVEGQIRGGFAQAIGAALYEEFQYARDGAFLSGTFADYLAPTVSEIPEPQILHMESPSPFTPLGAKGVGEGNNMSTPVCVANALADALGVADITLPLTPSRVHSLFAAKEAGEPADSARPGSALESGSLTGGGETLVQAPPQDIWRVLMDPDALAAVIPGCHSLVKTDDTTYRAEVTMGVGPVRGRFVARMTFSNLDEPRSLTLSGGAEGPLGSSTGGGEVRLEATAQGTFVSYRYSVDVGGKVAAVGGRMLEGAARLLIDQFFQRLSATSTGQALAAPKASWWHALLKLLGVAR